jgi:acyl-CoA thioesterase FadM
MILLQAIICDVRKTIPGHDVDVMAHVSNSNYVHVTVKECISSSRSVMFHPSIMCVNLIEFQVF